MNQKIFSLYAIIVMLALPVTAFAEGESFNPPNWVGAGMFFLALVLPLVVSVWVRSRK